MSDPDSRDPAGRTSGFWRVSVGLEDAEDIEADIADALVAARAVRAPATPAAV